MPSKGCIMRKISTVARRQTGQNAQLFCGWLYPMSIVSRVTIIRGNGARAAGARRDHKSCEFRSDDVRRCGQLCLPTTRARAALPPGAPETVQDPTGGRAGTSSSSSPRRASASAIPSSIPGSRTSATSSSAALYEDMVVIRRIDAEATALQRQGELALWPPLLGQEASQIGSARALRERRLRLPQLPRERRRLLPRRGPDGHRARLARATPPPAGTRTTVNMATPQIIIGAQTLHATGYAMGIQNDGADSVAVAYFGDGATSEGDVNEAMVFAASFQAPVVFFCQNNHWAISEPVRLQSHVQHRRPRPRLRHPQHAGGRQRRPGRAWPPPASPWTAPAAAAAPPSSRPSPTGWARTRRRTTPPATATPTSSRTGPPRTRSRRLKSLLDRKGLLDRRTSKPPSRPRPTPWPRNCAPAASTCPSPQPLDVFNHVYSTPNSWLDRQQDHYSRYLASFGDPAEAASEEGAR